MMVMVAAAVGIVALLTVMVMVVMLVVMVMLVVIIVIVVMVMAVLMVVIVVIIVVMVAAVVVVIIVVMVVMMLVLMLRLVRRVLGLHPGQQLVGQRNLLDGAEDGLAVSTSQGVVRMAALGFFSRSRATAASSFSWLSFCVRLRMIVPAD